jgi:hypothetical protein
MIYKYVKSENQIDLSMTNGEERFAAVGTRQLGFSNISTLSNGRAEINRNYQFASSVI